MSVGVLVLTIGRLPLVLISLKKPKVCKIFLTYEIVLVALNQCFVTSVDRYSENLTILLMYLTLYFMYHYDNWTTFIGTILSQVLNIVLQILLYQASAQEAFVLFFWNILTLVPLMLVNHGVITASGFLYADTEILRNGSNQMFDELNEGIIIVDDKTDAASPADTSMAQSNEQ